MIYEFRDSSFSYNPVSFSALPIFLLCNFHLVLLVHLNIVWSNRSLYVCNYFTNSFGSLASANVIWKYLKVIQSRVLSHNSRTILKVGFMHFSNIEPFTNIGSRRLLNITGTSLDIGSIPGYYEILLRSIVNFPFWCNLRLCKSGIFCNKFSVAYNACSFRPFRFIIHETWNWLRVGILLWLLCTNHF